MWFLAWIENSDDEIALNSFLSKLYILGFPYSEKPTWVTYIPTMSFIHVSPIELAWLQGFQQLNCVDILWNQQVRLLNMGDLHNYYDFHKVSHIELARLQGFQLLTHAYLKWPLTSYKINRIHLPNMGDLHTNYEFHPGFLYWASLITRFSANYPC